MNYTYAKDRYVHGKEKRLGMLMHDIALPFEHPHYRKRPVRDWSKQWSVCGIMDQDIRPVEIFRRGPKRPTNSMAPGGGTRRIADDSHRQVGRARRIRLNPGRRSVAENKAARV